MNLSDIKAIQIPEGAVTKIEYNNQVLWKKDTDILQMINPYDVPSDNTFINRMNGGLTVPSDTGGIWRHSEYIQIEEETTYLFGMAIFNCCQTHLRYPIYKIVEFGIWRQLSDKFFHGITACLG